MCVCYHPSSRGSEEFACQLFCFVFNFCSFSQKRSDTNDTAEHGTDDLCAVGGDAAGVTAARGRGLGLDEAKGGGGGDGAADGDADGGGLGGGDDGTVAGDGAGDEAGRRGHGGPARAPAPGSAEAGTPAEAAPVAVVPVAARDGVDLTRGQGLGAAGAKLGTVALPGEGAAGPAAALPLVLPLLAAGVVPAPGRVVEPAAAPGAARRGDGADRVGPAGRARRPLAAEVGRHGGEAGPGGRGGGTGGRDARGDGRGRRGAERGRRGPRVGIVPGRGHASGLIFVRGEED